MRIVVVVVVMVRSLRDVLGAVVRLGAFGFIGELPHLAPWPRPGSAIGRGSGGGCVGAEIRGERGQFGAVAQAELGEDV